MNELGLIQHMCLVPLQPSCTTPCGDRSIQFEVDSSGCCPLSQLPDQTVFTSVLGMPTALVGRGVPARPPAIEAVVTIEARCYASHETQNAVFGGAVREGPLAWLDGSRTSSDG